MAQRISLTEKQTGAGSDAPAEDCRLAILERYFALLRGIVGRVCPQNLGLEFDDIEQEARIRMWKALSGEREIRSVASYSHRVAVTTTIDAVRRVKARREEQLDGADESGRPVASSSTESPEEVAQQRQLLERVEESLRELPENRRRAVRLHLQGFSSVEIADLTGWTEPKSRNLAYRGLRQLRDALRRRGIEYDG